MAKLISRIAARSIERVTGHVVQPVASEAARGSILPSMPSLTGDMLKEILDTKDRKAQVSRTGADDYTHVSTLTHGVCARHAVIANIFDKRTHEAVTGGHRLMWRYGRVAEGHIRDQLTDGEVFGLKVYGNWKCACGTTSHVGTKPKKDRTCPKCETGLTNYFEQPLWDHDNKIVGNPDLGVFLGRFFLPVEIKSMTNSSTQASKKGQWENLTAPLAEHVNQALLYRYLAQKQGFLVHDKVLIVYAAKEFRFGSPYKIFDIDVTTPPYQRMLNLSLELAKTIRDGNANKKPPPRQSVCTSPDAKSSKACDVCATCWNLPE